MVAGDDWGVSGGKYALDFDGTNDFVTCSSPVLSGAVSQFSASCWVKTTASDDKSIFAKYYTTTNNRSWLMFIPNAASGATTEFAVNLSSNGAATLKSYRTTSVSINTGSWRHIGFSFSSGVLLLYVDGIERATTKTVDGAGSSFNWPNAIPLTMSAINTLGTPAALHQCQSDDFMCWNRVVTPREFAMLASRRGIAYELAPRRRSRVSVLTSLRYNIFTGNVGSLEVIGAS
jgi:hypothetical protein